MALNSRNSLAVGGSRFPKEGDEVWAKPIRIDSQNVAYLKSPYLRGVDEIEVHDLSDLPAKEYSTGRIGFKDKSQPVLLKISNANEYGDNLKGYPIEPDLDSPSVPETNREDSIDWDGTEQKSGSGGAKERNDLIKESDIRGSKNDLL